MNRTEKQQLVQDLHERLSRASITVATDYKGLDVEKLNQMRRELREAGVEYQVVKNTLLKLASQGTDAAAMQDVFTGPTAIALSYDDPVALAKVISKFASDYDHLDIKAGVLEGKSLDVKEIEALSKLPSREVLLAQVLSAMNGVPRALVTALSDAPRQMVNVLQAIKDQKEAA
ncbi:MAG: 50S ribosomal protein L10 [Deltaproteobacteria bacterium]|nr:MAG: 50S ribosomal protein L10 [Deltaproteobacteria bacterium]